MTTLFVIIFTLLLVDMVCNSLYQVDIDECGEYGNIFSEKKRVETRKINHRIVDCNH